MRPPYAAEFRRQKTGSSLEHGEVLRRRLTPLAFGREQSALAIECDDVELLPGPLSHHSPTRTGESGSASPPVLTA